MPSANHQSSQNHNGSLVSQNFWKTSVQDFAFLRRLLALSFFPVWWMLISLLFLVSRFLALQALPVFADEAIYLRWAQLITHSKDYLFFALNDGKPPLFIWSLLPGLFLKLNPLWVGRSISALSGLITWWISDQIIVELSQPKQKTLARFANALIMLLAPFWFFQQRMALMDMMLTMWIAGSWWGLIKLNQTFNSTKSNRKHHWTKLIFLLTAGLGWGLALWTKTPAIFWAPAFVVLAYWQPLWQKKFKPLPTRTLAFGTAGALGLGFFALLKISPAFGSLFGRSSDFTFTLTEVLQGQWRTGLDNIGRGLRWLSAYLRPEVLSLPFMALLLSRHRQKHWQIMILGSFFFLPLAIFGRTLHPRYFFPVALFVTISAALFITEIKNYLVKAKQEAAWLIAWLLVGSFAIASLRFILFAYFTPDQIPFVLADREQYLTEWSSGHGLAQVRDRAIEYVNQNQQQLTIVTEGSFGTLPDGLLMYFDQRPEIRYLRIEGLAQYPVKEIPEWVWEEARDHQTWLVVNSHRLELPVEQQNQLKLIMEYDRPYGAPQLLVFSLDPYNQDQTENNTRL